MITAAIAIMAMSKTAFQKAVELIPTDDVWVYPHAGDPEKDVYLRCWGAEGKAVAPDPQESEEFSYSYLRFDVSKLPRTKLKAATLTLTHLGKPGWTDDYAKDNPLQVRAIRPDFSEKSWEYDIVRTLAPDKDPKAVLGAEAPKAPKGDADFAFTVDLLKGPGDFRQALSEARTNTRKSLGLALTASLDVQAMGQRCIYKVYSKEGPADKRPLLKLTFE